MNPHREAAAAGPRSAQWCTSVVLAGVGAWVLPRLGAAQADPALAAAATGAVLAVAVAARRRSSAALQVAAGAVRADRSTLRRPATR